MAVRLIIFTILANILTLTQSHHPIHLTTDALALEAVSRDFGLESQVIPKAVLYPASVNDIAKLIKLANIGRGFPVSVRGNGHSVNGETLTSTGTVVVMSRKQNTILNEKDEYKRIVNVEGKYVDVWGGELWIDLLNAALEFGLAPKSWTDYLYLTIGGTLSYAGLSGQAYNFGPQISNVHQLEVVTGTGEILKCSDELNPELFYGVLGGLGQFGIITKARIPLEPAPKWVRRIKLSYSDFNKFTRDQEYLISLHSEPWSKKFDYVEGFVTYSHSIHTVISYNIDVVKNYDRSSASSVDQVVHALLNKLDFIAADTMRMTYIEFLDRVHTNEMVLRSKGLWDVPHPWLNLFVPKSKISQFDQGVFKRILRHNTNGGRVLIYPLNRNKWDERTLAVIPDEDVFYQVALLWSATNDPSDITNSLDHLKNINSQILEFCKNANINIKEYIPYYTSTNDWKAHFGPQKWERLSKLKSQFDPKHILSRGQHIFNPVSSQ